MRPLDLFNLSGGAVGQVTSHRNPADRPGGPVALPGALASGFPS